MKPINLLPPELRPRERNREGRGPGHLAIGVLAVLLLMAVVYALSVNQVNSHKTDIARAKSDIESAKAQVAASTAFGDFHQVKETRVASVKQLAAGRFDWERMMRELALVLPEHTWLLDASAATTPSAQPNGTGTPTPPPSTPAPSTSSSAGASTATAAGGATGSSSPSLDLKGCALRQGDVAVLLVRLRKLHRTEDVDLKESAQEVSSSGGAQPSSVTTAGPDTCGSHRFKFEVVVTFTPTAQVDRSAGDKVPAKLGGGS